MRVLEQQQGNQSGPDSNLQGVGAGAQEGLDAQVLFEGAEVDLHVPTLATGARRRGRAQPQMVGQQQQGVVIPIRLPMSAESQPEVA